MNESACSLNCHLPRNLKYVVEVGVIGFWDLPLQAIRMPANQILRPMEAKRHFGLASLESKDMPPALRRIFRLHNRWFRDLDEEERLGQPVTPLVDSKSIYMSTPSAGSGDRHGYIYVIFCRLIPNFVYIGQTQFVDLLRRFIQHIFDSQRDGCSPQRYLYRAMRTFGWSTFFIVPLQYIWYNPDGTFPKVAATRLENFWMFKFKSVLRGFNARYEGHPLKAKARPVYKPVVKWSLRTLQRNASQSTTFVLSP